MMRPCLVLLLLALSLSDVMAQTTPDYFVEAEVSNATPFIGQQIRFTFRLFSRIPSWTNSGLLVEPSYDGFWLQENPTQSYQAIIEGRSYAVRARNLALFPTHTGKISIDPVQFVIPDNPTKPGEVLVTAPVSINVQPLPEGDSDEIFTGLVGQIELLPTIDRLTTAVGDPVQLQLTVRGDANMAQLPIPDLPVSAAWRSYASPSRYQSSESEAGLIGEQTFTWLLTPLEAGTQAIPQINLTYFDPDSATYRNLSTSAVSIDVQPGETIASEDPVAVEAEALPLRAVPAILSSSTSTIPGWTFIIWLLAPLLTLGIWVRERHLEHRRRFAALYRRSEALKKAHNILEQARKQPPNPAYRMIWEAIMNYFADKIDQSAAALDYSQIEAEMLAHGIKPEIAAHVLGSLQRSDQARYAPFEADNASALTEQVMKILTRVDMVWQ